LGTGSLRIVDLEKCCAARVEFYGAATRGKRECAAAVLAIACQIVAGKAVDTTRAGRVDGDGLLAIRSLAMKRCRGTGVS
jgi:hypothetical protein